jgi:hypothetical protein
MIVEGNVIVVNNGRLRINGSRLRVSGNMHVLNNGGVEIRGGRIEFIQRFLYHRIITLSNTASLWLDGATLDLGGYNLACALTDSAALRFDQATVTAGIMTTSLRNVSRVDANSSGPLGEMIFFDSSRASFNDCTQLLSWLVLPPASVLRGRFPESQVLDQWRFPASMQRADGFGVELEYENCVELAWAVMSQAGCDAVIEDSRLLAVGAMYGGQGAGTVNGLVNGMMQQRFQFPSDDRSLHFERSQVDIWNLYAFDSYTLTVSNSVFGEVLAFERSRVTVSNSICDGSGGYIGSMDDAHIQFMQSTLRAPVISRQRSQLYIVLSQVQGHVAHAADNSVLALLHSNFTALPTVDDGSAAAVIGIDEPSQAPVNASVPIHGTVRFLPGKDVPISFVSYWIDGVRVEDADAPFHVFGPSIRQRYRDTLAVWNTAGLLPGDHALRIHMRLSSGDTIVIPWPVRLVLNTAVAAIAEPSSFGIRGIAPNPLPAGSGGFMVFLNDDNVAADIDVAVFDAMGRCILRESMPAQSLLNIRTTQWARGRYQLLLRRGSDYATAALYVH